MKNGRGTHKRSKSKSKGGLKRGREIKNTLDKSMLNTLKLKLDGNERACQVYAHEEHA